MASECFIKPTNKPLVAWFPHGNGKSLSDYYPISGFPLAACGLERPWPGQSIISWTLLPPKQKGKVRGKRAPPLKCFCYLPYHPGLLIKLLRAISALVCVIY